MYELKTHPKIFFCVRAWFITLLTRTPDTTGVCFRAPSVVQPSDFGSTVDDRLDRLQSCSKSVVSPVPDACSFLRPINHFKTYRSTPAGNADRCIRKIFVTCIVFLFFYFTDPDDRVYHLRFYTFFRFVPDACWKQAPNDSVTSVVVRSRATDGRSVDHADDKMIFSRSRGSRSSLV
jgi:hypothetical protein